MNHREASTIERTAPSEEEATSPAERSSPASSAGKPQGQSTQKSSASSTGSDSEILVVASKVKAYIKERSGMNTSAGVLEVLSERIRQLSRVGIENARADERKTVMARDIAAVPRRSTNEATSANVIIRRRPGA